jgi:dihydroflavonol-4-reductase
MAVLVTGATGFVGRHVAYALLETGCEVRALVHPGRVPPIKHKNLTITEGDICDRASLVKAVRGCEGVFHVAALYALWSRTPQRMYDVNVSGTRNLMEVATEAGVRRIVYTSTVAAVKFHPPPRLGNEEEDPDPEDLVGHYKKSKYQAEMLVRHMSSQGTPVVIVNPTTPIGPGDAKPTPTGRVVLDILRKRIPAYVKTGLNLVAVEDVATGHLLAMDRGQIGRRYILGHRNVTLKQFLDMTARIARVKPPLWCIPHIFALTAAYLDLIIEGKVLRREPHVPIEGVRQSSKYMWVDCSRAISELGLPQSPIEDALERAVYWYTVNGYVKGQKR